MRSNMNNMLNMKGVRAPLRERPPTQQTNRQRYDQQFNRYIESQFTYNTHNLLKKICQNGQNEPYMYGIPVYKILIEVVKIMMMNELQTLFLGSTLQEMKWKITDPCLNQYVNDAVDITPELQKDEQTKRVQFSLLLISYIVKMYLNEDIAIFEFKIREIVRRDFHKMYQTWVERVRSNIKFNPKNVNKIFKEYQTQQHENKEQIIDYNKLVAEYFKQNDTSFYEEREQEISKPVEEEVYQFKPMREPRYQNINDNYTHLYRRNTPKFNNSSSRKNQTHEVPMEEEVPSSNDRRQSARLAHRTSQLGFVRRESGNQFFAPETHRERSGIFALSLMNSKIEEESPHR